MNPAGMLAVAVGGVMNTVHEGGPPSSRPLKQYLVAWLCALLVGGFGIDRLYLGKIGTGIAKLVTLGGFGVWALVDLILLLLGRTRDRFGRELVGRPARMWPLWLVSAVVVVTLGNIGAHGSSSTLPERQPDAAASAAQSSTSAATPSATEPTPTTSATPTAIATDAQVTNPATTPAKPPVTVRPGETRSQAEARTSAVSYLRLTAFSRQELIDQLMFEGFSAADAEYGADASGADWMDQAAQAAQDLWDSEGLAEDEIYDELIADGFTPEQADYGAAQAG